jgi:hypothetical protein
MIAMKLPTVLLAALGAWLALATSSRRRRFDRYLRSVTVTSTA